MSLARQLQRVANNLTNQYGITLTLERRNGTEAARTVLASKKEKPVSLPWRQKKDVLDLPDAEPSMFTVPVPIPLPEGFLTPSAWMDDLMPQHSTFTTPSGDTYKVMRAIPIEAQDLVPAFNILCNNHA